MASTPGCRSDSTGEQRHVPGKQILDWLQAVLTTSLFVLGLNLTTGVATARALGPSGKGLYNAVMLWSGVGTALAGGGLAPAFILTYGESPKDRPATLTGSVLLAFLWGSVVATALLPLVPYTVGHLGSAIVFWTYVALVLIPIGNVATILQGLLQVEKEFSWYNGLRLATTMGMAVPLLALWLSDSLTPMALVVVALASAFGGNCVVMVAAGLLLRRRHLRLQWPVASRLIGLSALSARFYAVGLASLFNARLDQMLTTVWLNARSIGLYAVANSSITLVSVASGAFQSVFLPSVAGDAPSSIVARTATSVRRASWVLAAFVGATIILARPGLDILYGTRYLGAYTAIVVLTPAGFCGALLGVLYQGFYALHETSAPFTGEVVGAVSGGALLWAWVPLHGTVGAAAATSVSYLCDLSVMCLLWSRRHPAASLRPTLADANVVARIFRERVARLIRRRAGARQAGA